MNIAPETFAARQHVLKSGTVRSVFGFRHRGLIGVVLFAPIGAVVLFSAPTVAEHSPLGLVLNATGWLAFLLYAGLRVWATLYVGGHKDRELQTDGPYSLCRNPLYLGSFAFAVSLACFLQSIVFSAVLLPAMLLYLQLVVRAEEHFLELRFQEDYRNYCRRTPRFWPQWSGFHSMPVVRVDLKRLKKEGVRLGTAAAAIILLQGAVFLRAGSVWPHWFSVP
jgi:protein-S-isoprenylcysteine O-methyltransferase Ste14